MMSFNDSALGEQAGRGERSKYMASACSYRLCLVPETCPFDCIAITAPNPRASRAYLDELVHRVGGRGTKEMLILAVSDPEGVRIGSGGGTLNAILEVLCCCCRCVVVVVGCRRPSTFGMRRLGRFAPVVCRGLYRIRCQ